MLSFPRMLIRASVARSALVRPAPFALATRFMANKGFTKSHEWVLDNGDIKTVGITNFAQEALGDVVFVDLPQVGDNVTMGDTFGAIESVKAASDLYAPVSGEVVEVNSKLEEAPETVNEDPEGEGWMIKVKSPGDLGSDFLDEAAYEQHCAEESH